MTAAKVDGNSDGENKDKIMSYVFIYLYLGAMLPYPCCPNFVRNRQQTFFVCGVEELKIKQNRKRIATV